MNHVERSCTTKMRYRTHALAVKTATRLLAVRGVQLGVYECRYCRWWHLTKSAGPQVRKTEWTTT